MNIAHLNEALFVDKIKRALNPIWKQKDNSTEAKQ